MTIKRFEASFRDPSGYLFLRDDVLFRQVNKIYAPEYSRLMSSGLFDKLVKAGLIIPHEETDVAPLVEDSAFKIIRPERIPMISYPYEWSFHQYKEAALATLSILKRALKYDLCLKDASAYNIQFHNGKAILIDTLSFESYIEGEPWVAYRQFCQHFLAPLALMAKQDVRLGQLMRVYIDGVPLDLASRLLPNKTRLNLGLAAHIHLHSRAQKRYADTSIQDARAGRRMSKSALLGLIASLERTIRKLKWKIRNTEWGDYYDETNYTEQAFQFKQQQVKEWSQRIRPRLVWDLGANTGLFSRLAAGEDGIVAAFDVDPLTVDQNWLHVKKNKEKNILPLLLDLTNPSPGLGWAHRERSSLAERGPASLVLALALLHHMAIANNLPFASIAELFARIGEWLIIEFVPKSDSQVQRLLRNRKDIFTEYDQSTFEQEFSKFYSILEKKQVKDSLRVLYLMKNHHQDGGIKGSESV